MRFLLFSILAGIAVCLKPTVTELLQCPLQMFRALAPFGDTLARFTPPDLYGR